MIASLNLFLQSIAIQSVRKAPPKKLKVIILDVLNIVVVKKGKTSEKAVKDLEKDKEG